MITHETHVKVLHHVTKHLSKGKRNYTHTCTYIKNIAPYLKVFWGGGFGWWGEVIQKVNSVLTLCLRTEIRRIRGFIIKVA